MQPALLGAPVTRAPRRAWRAVPIALSFLTLGLWSAPSAEAQGGTQVVTRILWRVKVGTRPDLMTTLTSAERDGFPRDGQTFYLPNTQISGTAPIYRLFHPNIAGHMDHMDSMTPGEGGYQTEAPVGFGFTAQSSGYGLSRYLRTYKSANGDHGTRSSNEAPMAGYVDEALSAWGWARWPTETINPPLLTLTRNGVTVESNLSAGGAVWHWTHNGMQYINNRDYGRQMQSSLIFTRNAVDANPTEAGDRWGDRDRPIWARHGSPLALASNTGNTQSTRAVPLDFNPDRYGGGADNPVVYKDILLGKDLTLDFNGWGPIAKYTTVVASPSIAYGQVELPTAYLPSNFNRFWTYNAQTGALAEVFPASACANQQNYVTFAPGFGGVIISDASTNFAMGSYAVSTSQGGSLTHFRLYKFFCAGDGAGEFKFDTAKWTAIRLGSIPSGTKTYNSWVMTGSLQGVVGLMNQLFMGGYK